MKTKTYKSKGTHEIVLCHDDKHDYDGGRWWMVWDNETRTVLLETDNYEEAERRLNNA